MVSNHASLSTNLTHSSNMAVTGISCRKSMVMKQLVFSPATSADSMPASHCMIFTSNHAVAKSESDAVLTNIIPIGILIAAQSCIPRWPVQIELPHG